MLQQRFVKMKKLPCLEWMTSYPPHTGNAFGDLNAFGEARLCRGRTVPSELGLPLLLVRCARHAPLFKLTEHCSSSQFISQVLGWISKICYCTLLVPVSKHCAAMPIKQKLPAFPSG